MKKRIIPFGVKMLQIKVISLLMFLLLFYIYTPRMSFYGSGFKKENPYMEVIKRLIKG